MHAPLRAILPTLLLTLAACAPSPQPAPQPAPQPSPPRDPPPAPLPAPVAPPTPPPAPEPPREVFPGVRLDRSAGAVEFDGEIIQDGRTDPGTFTYLEVLACRPNSREHESIILTRVPPSNLQAALLLAGGVPGRPGSWTYDAKTRTLSPVPPSGPRLAVDVRWTTDGQPHETPLARMVRDARTGRSLADTPGAGFLFAGSAFLKRKDGSEQYAADVSGTLIGLCTFGDEPVAWSEVISPEESIESPEWAIDPASTPRLGTKVIVRLTPIPATTPTAPPAPSRP